MTRVNFAVAVALGSGVTGCLDWRYYEVVRRLELERRKHRNYGQHRHEQHEYPEPDRVHTVGYHVFDQVG